MQGAFAEFAAYGAGKVFKIHNLSDIDATLLEPARYVFQHFENVLLTFLSCAAHGLGEFFMSC